ncbi:NAD-dependent epimerase/dehydratase family protein [Plantibacter flavus]|uniref:NAD-dependent epimerase/dehydratase family protein n=1 Tax=Plantibacter flavus TaxID=150123 RepID=UPI003F154421
MSRALVLGAGLIGAGLTARLVERGDDVIVGTRSGTTLPGARAVTLDATDADAIATAGVGVDTVFLCVNPPYGQWATAWPPVFRAVVDGTARLGGSLVTMGNLYSLGRATMPMTEHSPEQPAEAKGAIRAAGWALAKAADDRGELRAVEVRASDYFGAGAGPTAHLGARFFEPLLAGRTARVVGATDQPHSWAYLPDIVSTLVAAADHDGEWGRTWHVPPSGDASRGQIAAELRAQYGATGRVRSYPPGLLATLGLFSADLREVHRSSYQFAAPFVDDASESSRILGVTATPWSDALAATVASYRAAPRQA